ncbi:hypothetical protein [Bizionia sp. M204]|uniref:hypothetical protein n=1 Tax=Bizionia sp. M204 TaxID=2675331 RepID=UPI0020547B39|nr:hypothetical protein [Bizionia sp. M204]UPS91404.1 hypothetical protein GMA17_06550 [Bizionia sp. M204]
MYNHVLKITLFLVLAVSHIGFSQIEEKDKNATDSVYEKIENFSEKSKSTKFLHNLIFKNKTNQNRKTTVPKRSNFRDVENKIVRHIYVDSHDPFGFSFTDSTETANSWLEKAGNTVHLKSKDFAIRNYLMFEKNQPLDSLLLIESERLLRSQDFIREVAFKVEHVAGSRDSVDVYITTLDSWSLIPSGSISSSKLKVKLREENFLGFGHQFKMRYDTRFSDNKSAYDVRYAVSNFKNTYINSAAGYTTTLEGAKSKYLNIERPFFSAYTKWAAGVYIDEQFARKWLPDANMDLGVQDLKYQSQDLWAGYSFDLFKGNTERERTTNIITSFRFLNLNYREPPSLAYDSIQYFSSETFYLGSIGISSRQFVDDRYLFRDGIIESVPVGDYLAIIAGNQRKNSQNRLYLGAKVGHGNYYNWGYLSLNMEYGTFFNTSKKEQTAYSFSANYFTNLISLGSTWKMRQFIKSQVLIGKNRLNSVGDRVTIDEYNDFRNYYDVENANNENMGIPGFDSDLLGTSKFLITLQTQFYPPWELMGFRVNPYLNIKSALLGTENTKLISSKLYSSFSAGVILKNDYLVFESIQLSISFYPSIPTEGNSIFTTNAISVDDFNLPGFELGKPAPIWYN